MLCMSNFVAPSVSFELSTYTVHEHDESVMPVLVLSNPSSIYIGIAVLTFDGSATGKCHAYYLLTITTFMCYRK